MLQNINMLDLRKRVGQVIDETFYRKDRFLIKRKDKAVAVILPLEDYKLFIEDESDIEVYSKTRMKEFEKQDRLTKRQRALAKKLINE